LEEIQQIEKRLESARVKLLASVEGLDEVAWDWQPAGERWSVRLTLAHVGSAHWSHLEVARRIAEGKTVELSGFELDEWNEARVAERTDWTREQVLADLQAAQQATAVFVAGLEPETLEIRGEHPALGEVNVGQALRVIALHDGLHRRDILKLRREMEA
jgi:hypothetical protein